MAIPTAKAFVVWFSVLGYLFEALYVGAELLEEVLDELLGYSVCG